MACRTIRPDIGWYRPGQCQRCQLADLRFDEKGGSGGGVGGFWICFFFCLFVSFCFAFLFWFFGTFLPSFRFLSFLLFFKHLRYF